MLKLLVTTKTVHKSAAVRSGRILQEIRPSFESGKALIMARYPGPDPARRDETAEAEVNAIIVADSEDPQRPGRVPHKSQ